MKNGLCVIKTKDQPVTSRLVQHLLDDPTCDGGQWDMVANLVNKYGLVPKCVYQESHHSSNSRDLNAVLKKKFSSSALTSLQSGAQKEQKWPLLNLVRQILRVCNYKMEPVRRSDGYDDEGKKKYKRFFLVKKFKAVQAQPV